MQGQRTVYAALLVLYKQYAPAIAAWDLVTLKPLFSEEQRLLRELALLEQRRVTVATRLQKQYLPQSEETLSLRQLMEAVSSQETSPFSASHCSRLLKLGEGISQDMAELERLRAPLLPALSAALSFLERNEGLLLVQRPSYSPRGYPKTPSTPSGTLRLDRKV